MVQLVRIVSNNETKCDITNFFNESITIKPNSKIALDSLKLEMQDVVTVTSDNNTFEIQVSKDQPNFTVTLNEGVYDSQSFIIEITRALAASMEYIFRPRLQDVERNYTEWKPILFNDKLLLQYVTALPDTGRQNQWKGDIVTGKIVELQQAAIDTFYLADVYYRTDNTPAPNYISTSKALLQGPAEFRVTCIMDNIPTQPNPTQSRKDGTFIGLRDLSAPLIPIQSQGDFKYAIGIESTLVNTFSVRVYIDGIPITNSFISTASNVSLKISTQDGIVTFWYSLEDINAGGIWTQVNIPNNIDVTYSYDTSLLGYVLMKFQHNAVNSVCYTSSPYQNLNSSGLSLVNVNNQIQDIETHIKYDNLGQPSQTATLHTIILSDKVKQLLGYTLNQYSVIQIASQFQAEQGLDLGYYSDEIIVELPSQFVKAYEGSQNRRRNIIRYIPSDLLQLTKTRSHTFQYPLYMELQNKDDIVLNYFQIRVLNKDFFPINISGSKGSMTALLVIE